MAKGSFHKAKMFRPTTVISTSRMAVGLSFGRVLRSARRQRGLSQEDLAKEADMDRTYPSLLERALRTPTITMIIMLARALDIRPGQMVDDTVADLQGEGSMSHPDVHHLERYLADAVKEFRRINSLTVDQLAELAKLSKEDVELIETGKFHVRLSHVEAIATVRGVDIAELPRAGGL